MWKPGQLVTISGEVCRITRGTCHTCGFWCISGKSSLTNRECSHKMGYGVYPKRIKQKNPVQG